MVTLTKVVIDNLYETIHSFVETKIFSIEHTVHEGEKKQSFADIGCQKKDRTTQTMEDGGC